MRPRWPRTYDEADQLIRRHRDAGLAFIDGVTAATCLRGPRHLDEGAGHRWLSGPSFRPPTDSSWAAPGGAEPQGMEPQLAAPVVLLLRAPVLAQLVVVPPT